jgi:hypothetical protein
MSQIVQQVVAPTYTDPDNVRETFVNGPMNVNIKRPITTLLLQ